MRGLKGQVFRHRGALLSPSRWNRMQEVVPVRASAAFGVAAGHARQASVLVGHCLLSAARAFSLGAGAVGDVLLERTLHAGFPGVDRSAVQVEGLDERNHVFDRHAVAEHPGDQLGIVPCLLYTSPSPRDS